METLFPRPLFMRIKEIYLNGFKKQNLVQPLTGRDIFVGPNGSGKSSRIEGIALALLGYCPNSGKTAQDTFKYATGDQISVGLRIDNGFKFERRFTKKVKSNIKTGELDVKINQTIDLEPSPGKLKETEKAARVMEVCGNFPVMLDFTEFLNLSDSKRREFIYNLSPFASQKGKADVEKYLRAKLLTDELEASSLDAYNIMEQLIDDCLSQYPEGVPVQDGLNILLDWVKSQQTFWKNEKKKSESAVQKLAEMKNQLMETDRNIAANKEELEKLQEALVRAEVALATDNEKKKANLKRAKRIGELTGLIQSVQEKLNALPQRDDVDARIKELETALVTVDFRTEIEPLIEKQKRFNKRLQELLEKKQELYKEKGAIEGQIKSQEAVIQNVKGIKTVIDPKTKQKIRICAIHHLIRCEKDFTPFLAHMEKQLSEAKSVLQAKAAELANIEAGEAQLQEELSRIQKEIGLINQKTVEASRKNEQIRAAINSMVQQKNELATRRQGLEKEIALYDKELKALQAVPPEIIAPTEILEKQVAGLRSSINSLKQKISEQEKAKATLTNLRSSMVDGKEAHIKYECCKLLSEAIGPKGLQGILVKEVLEPIRKEIQQNLQLMGVDNEFFFQTKSDTGKEIFQFGWITPEGYRVNFDALSTGQKIILLIAVMVTMLDRAKPPLKVLAIDNIENLDKENFQRVIEGLNALAHKVDNIVLAGVIENIDLPGWKIWNTAGTMQEELFFQGDGVDNANVA